MTESTTRVLVTGANGHLGRRLVQRLAESHTPVRAVVRSEAAADSLRALPAGARPEIRVLADYAADALAQAAEGCDSLVHLVGIIKESATSRYLDAHEVTARSVSQAAARAGLRRIVYLSIVGAHPESHNTCLASKGRAERILLDGPTPVVVLRVPMVLGPGDRTSRSLRAQARARFVPLLRGGAGREQPVDSDDVVAAIVAALTGPDLENVAFDLAGPERITRRELLERTAALHGARPRVVPLPLRLELLLAFFAEKLLRNPPFTRAMIGVLDHDDDVDTRGACKRLGISLTPLDVTLRRCIGPAAPE